MESLTTQEGKKVFDISELKEKFSDLRGVDFKIEETRKYLTLTIEEHAYMLTPDGALSLAAALRKSANRIKTLYLGGR